ncbi:hypothetical protein ACFQGE_14945 [Halomicroarcula sp. GCM10025817]|uniref:hypothetical protein n=1 Tax=Haloarcula TaxID=2237 RepID=UPI0023E8BA2C|nr:hypothetical protein [Halomicroarcula sp. SYNS111]
MAGTDNPVRRFRAFFRHADSVPSGAGGRSVPERSLVVDWQRLADFDPDLADRLLAHPDATVGYAREALTSMGVTCASTGRLPQLRFRNLPTDTPPEDLATVQCGQLVSISGRVVATTDVRPILTVITVECQQCGTATKGRYFGLATPEIESCWSCGRDENVSVTMDSDCIDTQYARLSVPDSVGAARRETIHVRLDGALTAVTPGELVTVTGVARPCQRTELNPAPTVQTRFVDCSDIVLRDLGLEPTRAEPTWTLGDLAARPTYLGALANAVAPSVPGFWLAKLVLALLYVTPTPVGSQSSESGPNILLLASDTSHRRRILEAFCELDPATRYQSLPESSSPPIVAEVEKRASRWWVETGPVVQAAGGIAAVDGIEYLAETQRPFLIPALTKPRVRLAKAGIDISLDTCARLVATATPTVEHPEDLQNAAPLNDDVLELFDLQVTDGAAETISQSELTQVWVEGTDTVSASDDVTYDRPETEVYRSALTQARYMGQPEIDAAALDRLRESHCDRAVVTWAATALAQLCGRQSVQPRDVSRAERVAALLDSM